MTTLAYTKPKTRQSGLHGRFIFSALLLLVLAIAAAAVMYYYLAISVTMIVLYLIRGLIVAIFILVGWRDIAMLFRRPGKNMGPGIVRVAAIARTTILEAWAGRIWLLPVLWLIASFVLIFSVRPFDESERIPLYIRMLLSGQEVLVLVIMWVMACVSLPRERERKIVVTNASKPLSRLEILLGKITGFSLATGAMLLVMGVTSLLILYIADYRLRGSAAAAYEIQKRDFDQTKKLPSEALRQLSEEGSLFAHNFIPPTDFNIGGTAIADGQIQRYLIGGTQEKVIYRFFPYLPVPEPMIYAPQGVRPYFTFYFPALLRDPNIKPNEVKIHVSASRAGPSAPQEADLYLGAENAVAWEPPRPEDLFSTFGPGGGMIDVRGIVAVEVTCQTPGVLLQVLEGVDVDPASPPANDAFNVEFSDRAYALLPGAPMVTYFPMKRPQVRGYERHDRQQIAGPRANLLDPEIALYRFPGSALRDVPVKDGKFTITVLLATDKGMEPTKPTIAGIRVQSVDRTGAPPFVIQKEVLEKRVMKIEVPEANLGDSDPSKRGDLIVVISCSTGEQYVSLIEDSVHIDRPETPFFINFFKSELVIWMEATVLIAICVTCSVRVGWPVAMFCSGVCALFGFLLQFLVSLGEYGGLGALNYTRVNLNDKVFMFLDNVTGWTWSALAVIARAVPNFTLFQFPQEYVPKLNNIPWEMVGHSGIHMVNFILPVIAIGYLLFRKQELA